MGASAQLATVKPKPPGWFPSALTCTVAGNPTPFGEFLATLAPVVSAPVMMNALFPSSTAVFRRFGYNLYGFCSRSRYRYFTDPKRVSGGSRISGDDRIPFLLGDSSAGRWLATTALSPSSVSPTAGKSLAT